MNHQILDAKKLMEYNFDKIIDRSGSDDLKHGALLPRWGRDDLLPLWVADMDFETPAFVTDALKARLEHSLFGYTMEPKDFLPSIIDWVRDHHQWNLEREWIKFIPGIVKGIGLVVNVFTKPDEKVIIQPPVYHPFRLTPEGNGREVVFNPLKMREDGYYDMDFDNLAEVCDEKCKVLILCNPHNPGGITWSKETLQRLADFCYEHHRRDSCRHGTIRSQAHPVCIGFRKGAQHQHHLPGTFQDLQYRWYCEQLRHCAQRGDSPEVLLLAHCQRARRAYPLRSDSYHCRLSPWRGMAQANARLHRGEHSLRRGLLQRKHPRHPTIAPAGFVPGMAQLPRFESLARRAARPFHRQGTPCPERRRDVRSWR